MVTQTKIPPLTVSNPWWGHKPSDKQWLGLYAYEECPDLFYGGAAGPGKTSFLLMAAVQYVHYPHYRALILRKTFADLSLPDAIMDRAISWWDNVEGARFNNQEKVCYFPSGAKSLLATWQRSVTTCAIREPRCTLSVLTKRARYPAGSWSIFIPVSARHLFCEWTLLTGR